MNPQHCIPTLKDDDFVLTESRAIASYLAHKYEAKPGAKKLYPGWDDPRVRARVDQRLYFDMGTFYKAFGECVYPMMFRGEPAKEEHLAKLREVLGWANGFLLETGYVAGTQDLTIADLAFLATFSSIRASEVVPLESYVDLNKWFEKVVKAVPNYEKANGVGAREFGGYYKDKLTAYEGEIKTQLKHMGLISTS